MIRFELSKGYHRVLNADTDGEQFSFDNSDDHHHTDDDGHNYDDVDRDDKGGEDVGNIKTYLL